jgi:hypothetical protein
MTMERLERMEQELHHEAHEGHEGVWHADGRRRIDGQLRRVKTPGTVTRRFHPPQLAVDPAAFGRPAAWPPGDAHALSGCLASRRSMRSRVGRL